jgi:hypothetical protein
MAESSWTWTAEVIVMETEMENRNLGQFRARNHPDEMQVLK